MSQSEQFHETWAHLRDHAKPVVPRDVDELAVVRTFQAPSKAHTARLTRVRLVVVPKRACERPMDVSGARRRYAELIAMRNASRSELKRLRS